MPKMPRSAGPYNLCQATPHVNVEPWKKVRYLPPFGVPDCVNKALSRRTFFRGVALAQVKNCVLGHFFASVGTFWPFWGFWLKSRYAIGCLHISRLLTKASTSPMGWPQRSSNGSFMIEGTRNVQKTASTNWHFVYGIRCARRLCLFVEGCVYL